MNKNKIILENLPLVYINELCRNKNNRIMKFYKYNINTTNDSYYVLVKYKFTCAMCGKEAKYCNLEYNRKFGYHFNAYTENGEMMTKDHIYPHSKGGLDCIKNYQLLCYSCNQQKKDISPMTLVTALREGYASKKSVEKAIKKGRPKVLIGV